MILILGQARTGTSLTGGILQTLGYDLGPTDDFPSNEWNPKGNFVDKHFHTLHRMLYSGVNMIGGTYLPPESPVWSAWHNHIELCLKKRFWAMKDHHLLALLDPFANFIKSKGGEIRVILCQRNQDDSLRSFVARSGNYNWDHAGKFQNDCTLLIEKFLAKHNPPRLASQFERSSTDPRGFVDDIASFAGVAPTQAAYDFVDPALHRFIS